MIYRDQFQYAFGSLRKTRLRTALTMIGVAIGIGAMSSMVSIGVGTERRVLRAFSEESILTAVMVRPRSDGGPDDGEPLALDAGAVGSFAAIPGVRDAYPILTIPGLARIGDTQKFLSLEGMPARLLGQQIDAGRIKLLAGRPYSEGEEGAVVVSERAAAALISKGSEIGSLIGERMLFLAAGESNRVPGTTKGTEAPDEPPARKQVIPPILRSLPLPGIPGELPLGSFEPVVLELTVAGIVEGAGTFTDFLGISLLTPLEVVEPLFESSFGNLESLLTGDSRGEGYPIVQVLVENVMQVQAVQQEIRAMGFAADSVLDRIAQVRRGFLLVNSFLATIGGISLFVAAMMIVNTLVVAVLERTREIGLLKSLGATDSDVMRLFLTEAGVIGLFGGAAGLVLGWVVARITNVIMNYHFERIGEVKVDLVAFPLWLILGGLGFALVVSLLAGYYPSRRAARVNPVVALRHF